MLGFAQWKNTQEVKLQTTPKKPLSLTNARHLPLALSQQPPKEENGSPLDRARQGSIADMQLCEPLRWLVKGETVTIERIRQEQQSGHTIELQIMHPT